MSPAGWFEFFKFLKDTFIFKAGITDCNIPNLDSR